MNLKDSIARATRDARKKKEDMVVGKDCNQWIILPVSDAVSDTLEHAILVNKTGVKYPEDHEKVYGLIAQGE